MNEKERKKGKRPPEIKRTTSQKIKKYFRNILISIDQFGNVLFGGDPDEVISSRIGKIKRKHGGKIPRYKFLPWIIDAMLEEIDPNHSIDAIEDDEGASQIN